MGIDPDAVLWSAPERERAGRPLLVLLHGYGSHEGDLFSLAQSLPLEPVIASVRAPLAQGPGYAWFPPVGPLLAGQSPAGQVPAGQPSVEERFAAINESTSALIDWLDTTESTGVGLLGFSQGAAMALQLLREQPTRFDYVVALSGFVVPNDHGGDARLAELRPPVFWGRGTDDTVIASSLIDHTIEWLPAYSTLTEGIYEGVGHWVSPDEISELGAFIRSQL
ncbi:dienelactone hydrolase family protein [Leifsonia bigeumensis]|uniref:Dienelactone hydrolase family protein n=1 Tax=Leifsonella bigeumensis TaxID=433643 RepID=A0ABP7F6P5_9MICO